MLSHKTILDMKATKSDDFVEKSIIRWKNCDKIDIRKEAQFYILHLDM